LVDAVKAVGDFTIATDNPSQLEAKGMAWGVAKVKQTAGSKDGADIAVAQSKVSGTIPNTVIAVASKTEDIQIVVPKGNWDIEVVSGSGKVEIYENKPIESGQVLDIKEPIPYGVTISTPADSVALGQPVSFTATVTGDRSGITSYEWDFGDGSAPVVYSGNTIATKTYSAEGWFTVRVLLKNVSGVVLAEGTAVIVVINAVSSGPYISDTRCSSFLLLTRGICALCPPLSAGRAVFQGRGRFESSQVSPHHVLGRRP
jgi:hypothetical protein